MGVEPHSVVSSALKLASPTPAEEASPLAPSPRKRSTPFEIPTVVGSDCQAILERAVGVEPTTASLEGWDSTAELRPPEIMNMVTESREELFRS